jgi:hypothetical protein
MVETKKKRTEEVVYLKGLCKWVKHLQPDFTWEPDGKWSMVIYLEGEELDKARKLQAQGIKNVIKNDDDGWFMTLSRKASYEVRGRKVGREPPRVFTVEGENEKPVTEMVGNSSTGTAKCVLWSSPNFPGKNLRWEALRVDTLVPYTQKDYPDGGEKTADMAKVEPLF